MAPHGKTLLAREPGAPVILRPALLVPEAKAAAENVLVRALAVVDPPGESRFFVGRLRLLARRRVEVEVGLDAAREHIGGTGAPERAHQSPPTVPRCAHPRTAAADPLCIHGDQRKAVLL